MPDRQFIYVCSAGQNMIVNLSPLLQLEEVEENSAKYLAVLVGTNDPPSAGDRNSAHFPSWAFYKALWDEGFDHLFGEDGIGVYGYQCAGLFLPAWVNGAFHYNRHPNGHEKIVEIRSAPYEFSGWEDAIKNWLERLPADENPELVLNTIGGTTFMTIGALSGLIASGRSWHAIGYSSPPPETTTAFTSSTLSFDRKQIRQLSVERIFSLAIHKEISAADRLTRETTASCREDFTRTLYNAVRRCTDNRASDLVSVLHSIADGADGKFQTHCFYDDRYNQTEDRRLRHAGQFWGDYFNNIDVEEIDFANDEEKKYYRGGWFEEYVYLRCREIVKDKRAEDYIRIHLNVEFAHLETATDATDGEIDIVVQAGNDLHLVECKAGRIFREGGVWRSSVEALASDQRKFCGRPGTAHLVCFQSGGRRGRDVLTEEARAQRSSLSVYFGSRDAVICGKRHFGDFETWLYNLCDLYS